jgi:putative ABC transport system substrate-binding protein
MKRNQQLQYLSLIITIFFIIITGLLLTACGGAQDQETYTIGVINLAPDLDSTVAGFKEGMTELGYIEDESITYIYDGPADSIEKLDSVAQGLVEAEVDLILSLTTPATQASQRATADTDIPVVFVPVTDPVGAGIVDSLQHPGGNITGVTFGTQEARRLGWLIQVVPTIEQVYIPYNPEDKSAVLALETVMAAATTFGVELIPRQTRNAEEITAAIENIPEQADAIFILPDGLVTARFADFVELQLPTSGPQTGLLESAGALTSYGFEQVAVGKQAARLADQIFRGIKPADLPVETAEFLFAINLQAAEAIALDIPEAILRQADIIIR